ncbi:hypothetical protein [Geobacter sp. AOG1]|uniref:hypothetical protein n=1 Tax=Geobacter sp. AOG1 TaxID=1566346 RepID=UPI001CC59453|nr:hypothetical protein [Geobacter sp. AOG1]GFE58723.1 hypothetical protein AOG1_26030 [Geobacter sp. AOG1]
MNEMEALFAEWKKLVMNEADHFVEDGIIYPEMWSQARKKILFILKETNDYKGSISKLIHDASTIRPKSGLWGSPTFHNIGRWAYGLLNYPQSVGAYKAANNNRKKSVLSCSFINLKKTTGGRTATKTVDESAQKYSKFIRRQIEIIDPEIIVFGGTFQIVKDNVIPELARVSTRIHQFGSIICINANHPACTKKRTLIYDQVVLNYHKYISEKENSEGSASASLTKI